MNVFMRKDFSNQVSFADTQTKRKLQMIFMRKELNQLKDAQDQLRLQAEREKQECKTF